MEMENSWISHHFDGFFHWGRWDAFRPLDKAFSLSFALGFLAEPRHRPLAEKTRQEAVLCFNGKNGHCIDGQTIFLDLHRDLP